MPHSIESVYGFSLAPERADPRLDHETQGSETCGRTARAETCEFCRAPLPADTPCIAVPIGGGWLLLCPDPQPCLARAGAVAR